MEQGQGGGGQGVVNAEDGTTPKTPSTPKMEVASTNNAAADGSTSDTSSDDSEGETSRPPTGVSDFGVASDQNWKYRRRMEDAHYVQDAFNGDPGMAFFGIYDGHGGKEAAVFASQTLHLVLAEKLQQDPTIVGDPPRMLKLWSEVYAETDRRMKDVVPSHHGCTSVTCLVAKAGNSRHLYTANTGDARAVLVRDGKAIRLTEEHKASDEKEAKRIQDLGGFIINGRVNGQIVITRSLGDHIMKEFIISEPYTSHYELTEKDTHLIVACDGLWDVCEDQAAADFVLSFADAKCEEISKRLLVKALKDGSTDNLSCTTRCTSST